jgi:2-polyprenyl-6-hydroxyphenyl methylase/3-demethylubiquinone-9 3-methyltransferase
MIPKGTHDWNKFLTPGELTELVEAAGMKVIDVSGLSFSPGKGFAVGDDTKLDYFLTVVRG